MANHSMHDTQQLVESRWKKIRSTIREKWPQMNDDELRMVGGDSRKLIALIKQKTDMTVSEIEKAIDEIAASSGGLLSRVLESAGSMAKSAKKHVAQPLGQAYHQAQHQVAQHPGISLSTAFCAGMLIGVCLAAMNRD